MTFNKIYGIIYIEKRKETTNGNKGVLKMWIVDILAAFEEIKKERNIFTIGCIDRIEGNFIFFSGGSIYDIIKKNGYQRRI